MRLKKLWDEKFSEESFKIPNFFLNRFLQMLFFNVCVFLKSIEHIIKCQYFIKLLLLLFVMFIACLIFIPFFFREIIKEFAEFLGQDRSPLCNTKLTPTLPQNIQRHLTHFSLITHGFGSHAIVSALSAAQNYINESIKYLDKQISNYSQAAVSGADVSLVIDSKKDDGKQWRFHPFFIQSKLLKDFFTKHVLYEYLWLLWYLLAILKSLTASGFHHYFTCIPFYILICLDFGINFYAVLNIFFFISFALPWTIRFCAWNKKRRLFLIKLYYILLVERRTKQVLFFACQIFMREFIR